MLRSCLLYSKVIQIFIYKYKFLYTHILLYILCHYGLSQNIEYNFMCSTVGLYGLSILHIIVHIC